MSENQGSRNTSGQKRRSVTSVTLGWIAERIRKAERLKELVNSGSYTVDSEKVARSISNEEE